jgi:hypothetical protein
VSWYCGFGSVAVPVLDSLPSPRTPALRSNRDAARSVSYTEPFGRGQNKGRGSRPLRGSAGRGWRGSRVNTARKRRASASAALPSSGQCVSQPAARPASAPAQSPEGQGGNQARPLLCPYSALILPGKLPTLSDWGFNVRGAPYSHSRHRSPCARCRPPPVGMLRAAAM